MSTLVRARDDRWIAGVCGGIARRFGWSSNGTRLVYVLVSVLSAAGAASAAGRLSAELAGNQPRRR